MASSSVGVLLRDWRSVRNRSQLDLSLDVGVSARHLSFVETGRSTPSAELVLAMAHHLEVPLRDRNALLMAAGYAPRFSQTPLDDPSMTRVRESLQRVLDAHDPYPGVVIDRQWNVVASNASSFGLLAGIPAAVLEPTLNVFRLCLHPDGLAARTRNFEEWADHLLGQIRRSVRLTQDDALAEIEREVLAYPNVAALERPTRLTDDPTLLVPLVLDRDGTTLSMFTTLTTFGTPRDVTLDELSIELFYPADDATDAALGQPI